jgi:hypothetical protein
MVTLPQIPVQEPPAAQNPGAATQSNSTNLVPAHIPGVRGAAAPPPATQRTIHTAQLITTMLKAQKHVSDLIFSPGRAPQIESNGQLI